MNEFLDYSFFHEPLSKPRRLLGCTPWHVEDGAKETGSDEQLSKYPKIITPPDTNGENCVFETTSYANSPGFALNKLQEFVRNPLPLDFISFYNQYAKALVVTRTYPLCISPKEMIIKNIHRFHNSLDGDLRIFRFGDQYELEATQYGLWLEEPGTMKWRVVTTALGIIDDMDEAQMDPDRIVGECFYDWIRSWIARDGLPDPTMDLGAEGGFLDPV